MATSSPRVRKPSMLITALSNKSGHTSSASGSSFGSPGSLLSRSAARKSRHNSATQVAAHRASQTRVTRRRSITKVEVDMRDIPKAARMLGLSENQRMQVEQSQEIVTRERTKSMEERYQEYIQKEHRAPTPKSHAALPAPPPTAPAPSDNSVREAMWSDVTQVIEKKRRESIMPGPQSPRVISITRRPRGLSTSSRLSTLSNGSRSKHVSLSSAVQRLEAQEKLQRRRRRSSYNSYLNGATGASSPLISRHPSTSSVFSAVGSPRHHRRQSTSMSSIPDSASVMAQMGRQLSRSRSFSTSSCSPLSQTPPSRTPQTSASRTPSGRRSRSQSTASARDGDRRRSRTGSGGLRERSASCASAESSSASDQRGSDLSVHSVHSVHSTLSGGRKHGLGLTVEVSPVREVRVSGEDLWFDRSDRRKSLPRQSSTGSMVEIGSGANGVPFATGHARKPSLLDRAPRRSSGLRPPGTPTVVEEEDESSVDDAKAEAAAEAVATSIESGNGDSFYFLSGGPSRRASRRASRRRSSVRSFATGAHSNLRSRNSSALSDFAMSQAEPEEPCPPPPPLPAFDCADDAEEEDAVFGTDASPPPAPAMVLNENGREEADDYQQPPLPLPPPTPPKCLEYLRQSLFDFYSQRNPTKAHTVDGIIAAFSAKGEDRGRALLQEALVERYGVGLAELSDDYKPRDHANSGVSAPRMAQRIVPVPSSGAVHNSPKSRTSPHTSKRTGKNLLSKMGKKPFPDARAFYTNDKAGRKKSEPFQPHHGSSSLYYVPQTSTVVSANTAKLLGVSQDSQAVNAKAARLLGLN